MKLKNQVCTIEQAKRLKEIGVVQFGNYHWLQRRPHGEWTIDFGYNIAVNRPACYHALSVAELGVMLPEFTYSWRGRKGDIFGCLTSTKAIKDEDEIEYLIERGAANHGSTEAEARAAKLISLLESGKVTADEVNHRLANS